MIYPAKQIQTSLYFYIYFGRRFVENMKEPLISELGFPQNGCFHSSTFRLPREWTYLHGKCPESKSVHLDLTLLRKLTKAQYNRSGTRRQ